MKKNLINNILIVLPLLCLQLAVSGCASMGYTLGASLPPGVKSVHVPPFQNASDEPTIETAATKAAIEEFQKDGSVKVVSEENADAIVHVKITSVKLETVSLNRDNTQKTKEYRLKIAASVEFVRRKTNEVILKRNVEGEYKMTPTGDISAAKKLTIPLASKDLAHKIVECVVEYW
jgi:hypothetical protein